MSLSIPPVKSSFPASAKHIAVMGKSVGMKVTASLVRVSQIYLYISSVLGCVKWLTYTNVAVVGAADEHLLSALTHVHAIDHLFVSRMPSYPLASLYVPARQVHICRC